MNVYDKNIIQILKDNAFYVVLGLGLIAILAVIAIYTANASRTGRNVSQEIDLNESTQMAEQSDTIIVEDIQSVMQDDMAATEEDIDEEDMEEEDTEEDLAENTEEDDEEKIAKTAIDVNANAGELNFGQDSIMTWPIAGNVIIPFSMETTVYFETLDQYKCNPAMLIEAKTGDKVSSAYLGLVKSVSSSNELGNQVKVYIGNGYSIVYGQLTDIAVKEGDYVKAGDFIGNVGEPTDFYIKEGPHLFFQLLDEDDPVNPMLYMD